MKKLPEIYKNKVKVNNNKDTFYSKNENLLDNDKVLPKRDYNVTIEEQLKEIFKNKQFSYTKRVMVSVNNKTYETRFISQSNGKILTIDDEIIDIKDIVALDIIA